VGVIDFVHKWIASFGEPHSRIPDCNIEDLVVDRLNYCIDISHSPSSSIFKNKLDKEQIALNGTCHGT